MESGFLTWRCMACGDMGAGDMPEEHMQHQGPVARELVCIVHPSTGWGITTVPIELLSPGQRQGLYFDKRSKWWCAPLPP